MKDIKNKKYIRDCWKILKLILISVFIEIFVCNFFAFKTIFIGNNDIKPSYKVEENKIIISDIGIRTTSVYIDYETKPKDIVSYQLKYIAEDNDKEIELDEKVILPKDKHYINLDTHANCDIIQVDVKNNDNIKIKEILINHPNFNINVFRILIIFGISFIIYKLKDENIHNKIYKEESFKQEKKFITLLIVMCALIFFYTIMQNDGNVDAIFPKRLTPDDALSMQTESFLQGQTALLEKTDSRLVEMQDPYNHMQKINNQIPFWFDTAYYQGNYYNYFGIAPIITLILPFRLLTGMYLQTYMFNLVYVFGIVFLLYDVYKKLIKKFVKKISLYNFYLGYFAIFFGSNVLMNLRGAKYDIVITCGIMFMLLAMDLAIRIGFSEKYRKLKFIGLGISMGLMVLSKPTFIFYYPLIGYLVWINLRNLTNKEKIKNCVYTAIPLGIFAIIQMIYNYVRFDSILEFGAKYQLTASNMQYCMMFTFGKTIGGLVEYIFKLPTINLLKFPFVFMEQNATDIFMNEFCYEADLIGLIAIPILWVYLFAKNILKEENKDLKIFTKISLITAVIAIVLITTNGGICESYILDLKCILTINAVILLLKNTEQKECGENKNIANKVFVILCVSTILIMLPISISGASNWLEQMSSETTVFFKNIFEFWN